MSRRVELATLTYSGLQEICKLANMGFNISVECNAQGDDIVLAKNEQGHTRTFLLSLSEEVETDD